MGEENNIAQDNCRQLSLEPEDVLDENVYGKVWMTVGDEKERDIAHLIRQGRVSTQPAE